MLGTYLEEPSKQISKSIVYRADDQISPNIVRVFFPLAAIFVEPWHNSGIKTAAALCPAILTLARMVSIIADKAAGRIASPYR
jgi:hypothetical protein